MTLWQRTMVRLARSERAKAAAGRLGGTALARRFVAGETAADAVATARRLRDADGTTASLFSLGEYVDDPGAVAETVTRTHEAIAALGEAGLDVNVSVDPTAIGQLAGAELIEAHAEELARAVAAWPAGPRNSLLLDMEDLSLVAPTLALHRRLLERGLPVGVTLQARLRRTESDLRSLLGAARAVRLVKGAFPLGAEHDVQGRDAIAATYLRLAELMLGPEARESGLYPIFATHDDRLAAQIADVAQRHGWTPDAWELEMLYGVRPDWQRELRRRGLALRLYLPFGRDWWPYAVRRIGENPRNALAVVRALRR